MYTNDLIMYVCTVRADTIYAMFVYILDLVPKPNVEGWLKYLRQEFPTVAFKASTQSQKQNLVCLYVCTYYSCSDVRIGSSECRTL